MGYLTRQLAPWRGCVIFRRAVQFSQVEFNDGGIFQDDGVVFQSCTLPMQSVHPNSYRLTNHPITMSCIGMALETQIVLRVSRVIRVRKVRWVRSICCVLRWPGWCASATIWRV